MPRFGLIGAVTWNLSLTLYELLSLGRQTWWWEMHRALRREFKDIDPNKMVLNMRGPQHIGSLAYGETPALSVLKMLDTVQLPAGSHVVDVGSGRGVPCLTAAARGFRATGLEYFAVYTERSQRVAEGLGWSAEFVSGSFLRGPLPKADFYLISASAFPEDVRQSLFEILCQVPADSWVVAQDWILDPPFQLERMQQLPVSWGIAKICYHRRSNAKVE